MIRLLENKLEGGYHALNEEGALIRAIRYPHVFSLIFIKIAMFTSEPW